MSNKLEKSIAGHPMTDEQKLRVLNTTMKFQEAIFAADNVEDIPWFYCRKTKQMLKSTVSHILGEHGNLIKALWGEGGTKMDQATMAIDEYNKEMATLEYWKLPEVTLLIQKYKEGQFDHLFLKQEVKDGE